MAIQVGRAALSASTVSARNVRWTLHTGSGYQGAMGWPVHHSIQFGIVGDAGNALEVKQYCAGGLTTWILADDLLTTDDDVAVCTGADNWAWGDRFATSRSLGGEPFSDVASATVLTPQSGFAEILGYGTASCPQQADRWQTSADYWAAATLEDYSVAYRRAVNLSDTESQRASLRMLADAVWAALTSARVSPQYITHFVPHGSGSGEPYRTLAGKLRLPWSGELHERQLDQGYLAVSTQTAGLIDLVDMGLPVDSIVLLVAAEYQLSATAIVLRIRRTPKLSVNQDIKVIA
jgi:3-oxoacyl-[acyl-carrier-protein] synthase III